MSSFKVKLNFIDLNQRKKGKSMIEILLSLLKVILSTDAEHAQYMLNHS